MKKILIGLFLLLTSITIWGQGGQGGGGYGSGAGYPANSLIAQGVLTYYRNTTQGGNPPKWYDINATGTAYVSRDSASVISGVVPISAILPFGRMTVGTAGLTQTIPKDAIAPAFNSSSGYELSRFQLWVTSGGTTKFQDYSVDYTVTINTNSITVLGISGYAVSDKLYFRFQ